jgi:hypothetical protein
MWGEDDLASRAARGAEEGWHRNCVTLLRRPLDDDDDFGAWQYTIIVHVVDDEDTQNPLFPVSFRSS